MTFDKLLDKKISGIEVSEGEQYLRFRIEDDDDVVFAAYEDCCSETWFAEILDPDAIIGEFIKEYSELTLPQNDDGRSRQESDCFYGFALRSVKGTCTIVFRNSSNGYYGGYIEYVDYEPQQVKWRQVQGQEWTAY